MSAVIGEATKSLLPDSLARSIRALQILKNDAAKLQEFQRMAAATIACYRRGGRLYIAGNGGSAADAQHLAAEFVSRLARDRAPLPAESLGVDGALLTAIGNDYGFEQVFSRQLAAKLTEKDLFLAITSSGNSPNILHSLLMCRDLGVTSLLFAGHGGGQALGLANFGIVAPGETTSIIQEVHIVLAHALCESVEQALFGS